MMNLDIKRFVAAIATIQVAMLIVLASDLLGLDMPILRQVIGFIFLVFTPGITVLRVLRINEHSLTRIILYSVGLSVAMILFLGVLMNMAYPEISNPVSVWPMVATLITIEAVLCFLAYIKERRTVFVQQNHSLAHPPGDIVPKSRRTYCAMALLFLLPLISVFGTFAINFYNSNVLLLLFLAITSVIPVLLIFDLIPENLYPLAVFLTSLSLLLHGSLISKYLVEWGDMSWEYHLAKTVLNNSFWDWSIPVNYNGALSIAIFAPFLSKICKLDLTWVFKIAYPLLFSLVPLGLYAVVQDQTTKKVAFLSAFFFMAVFTFYSTELGLARFQIAAIFLVLLLLLIVDRKMDRKKALMYIIFCFSLIVSHYAVSSILMLIFVFAAVFLIFRLGNRSKEKPKKTIFTSTSVLLFVLLTLIWSIYVASGSVLQSLTMIGESIWRDFFIHFLDPTRTQGLNILLSSTLSPLHQLTKYTNLIAEALIAIGIVAALLSRDEGGIKREYLAVSLMSFGVLVAGLVLPNFASAINTDRLYHLNLFFLSPFCILGGMVVLRKTSGLVGKLKHKKNVLLDEVFHVKVISVFLVAFFLINSGFVYEIAGQPINVPVSMFKVWEPHFTDQDVNAAVWSSDRMSNGSMVFADLNNAHLLMMTMGIFSPLQGDKQVVNFELGSYIFLGTENIETQKIRLEDPTYAPQARIMSGFVPIEDLNLSQILLWSDKIFDSGNSQLFFAHASSP